MHKRYLGWYCALLTSLGVTLLISSCVISHEVDITEEISSLSLIVNLLFVVCVGFLCRQTKRVVAGPKLDK